MPPETADGGNLLSTSQAARAIGVHQTTLSRWVKAGYVKPAQKTIGGHMRWDLDALREQVAQLTDSD
ncbi:helix-turn-helix domain-containing protein [Pseudonocardia sp. T1-2H]|uniref:helix-turn-helix domain-containing protein n=1 Tax=Pseudonocardia sp. T1-2H TaxID=3128899 RepID=UPI004053D0E5